MRSTKGSSRPKGKGEQRGVSLLVHWRSWRAQAAPLAFVLLPLLGCNRPADGLREQAPPSPAAVEVVHPRPTSLRRVVEQPGSVQAFEETQLFARVPGYVSKVLVDIGEKVTPGQVLAEISVPELEEELNHKKALVRQAEADVEQARMALAAAEAHIATAEASVLEAKASEERWASELRRIARMVQSGVMDAQTRDETLNQHKAASAKVLSAEAAVKKTRADRDKAKADVLSAQARVEVARAEARRLEALLAYARVRAPYAGVVTRRRVNTGDFVQPVGGKGDSLFVLARLDPVRIVIDVPEADAALVMEKSEVSLSIPALRGRPVAAKVTRTSWALNPGSRTLQAEVELPNKDGKLRPGMYVYARVHTEQPVEWALPASAVVKQGDAFVCYLIEGDKVVRTAVQAGRSDGQHTEVLRRQIPGAAASWVAWTGKEEVAARAAGLTDGQAVLRAGAGK